jgi:hypothetical protein
MNNEQFSNLTLNLTKILNKEEKKNYGIFITPNSIITSLFNIIKTFLNDDLSSMKKILEPSCGTCEIINFCDETLDNVEIDGVELNKNIYNSIKDLHFKNNVKLYNEDFIKYNPSNLYDLIIGNPPYLVCNKNIIPGKYEEFIYGRPNIFGLFIIHSLNLLKPGGILAFVVPYSFLNSLYYSKVRNYIKKTCSIIKIDDYKLLDDFIETKQHTFGLIIQKNKIPIEENECKYSILLNNKYIFTTDNNLLKEIFKNTTTIEKMGLKVRTGQIVWNKVKQDLTDDDNKTILIYNTNISNDNKLEIKQFKNDEKKQFINRAGRNEPVLIVNRGNGNSDYKLNYAIISEGPFLVENHLNEIYSPKKIKKEDLLKIYEKITKSFENPKTKKFIEIFLGNNSLSKTELETIFPIYEI